MKWTHLHAHMRIDKLAYLPAHTHIPVDYYYYYLLLAYSPVNRSRSPQGFSQVQISHTSWTHQWSTHPMRATCPNSRAKTVIQGLWEGFLESNDSPEFPDRGETSESPSLPSGCRWRKVYSMEIIMKNNGSCWEWERELTWNVQSAGWLPRC